MFNPFICERFELGVQSVCRIHSLDAPSRNLTRVRRSHSKVTLNEGPLVSESTPVPRPELYSAGTLFSSQGATSRCTELRANKNAGSKESRRVADSLGPSRPRCL